MLVPININTQDLLDQFDLSQGQLETIIDRAIKEVTRKFAEEWEGVAKRTLKGTRNRYIKSLKVIDSGRMSGAVILDYSDPLVAMLEEGASSFDMKLGFANSEKAKQKKDGGWYLTIPYRFGAAGSLGESEVFNGGVMPTEIYNIAKNKGVVNISDIPEKYKPQSKNIQLPGSKAFEEYKQKTSIYAGIKKIKDRVTGQNSYQSFRRVSDVSDQLSWVHPGFSSKNLAAQALQIFEGKIPIILGDDIDKSLDIFGF